MRMMEEDEEDRKVDENYFTQSHICVQEQPNAPNFPGSVRLSRDYTVLDTFPRYSYFVGRHVHAREIPLAVHFRQLK